MVDTFEGVNSFENGKNNLMGIWSPEKFFRAPRIGGRVHPRYALAPALGYMVGENEYKHSFSFSQNNNFAQYLNRG